jgi:hypothetical protein
MAKLVIKFNVTMEYDGNKIQDSENAFKEATTLLEDKKELENIKNEIIDDLMDDEDYTTIKIKNFKWEVIE